MPQVMTEKSHVVALNAPKAFGVKSVPGGVAMAVEAEGVAHTVTFSPDEADGIALVFVRCAQRARDMAETAAAPTMPRIIVPGPISARRGNGSNGSGSENGS